MNAASDEPWFIRKSGDWMNWTSLGMDELKSTMTTRGLHLSPAQSQ